ncbi:MAG: SOUL family heme-binding protein [Candidatus Izemoplasmataceae bacterium]
MAKYESPSYTILKKDKNIEVRHYDTYYTSTVHETSLAGKSGFGVLFSYISGKNDAKKKISMTVPVINELDQDMSMEFVVPKEYYDNIPSPQDKRITIKKHPEKEVAVYSFSGFSNEKKIQKIQTKLQIWLKDQHLTPTGNYILARYNPPITPPCFRKNELMIEIME